MLFGIGNYTMGAADDGAGRQPMSSGGGAGGGGGGDSVTSVMGALSQGIIGITGALRGPGAGAAAPAAAPARAGMNLGGVVLPIAVVGLVLVGGYLVVKKLRKK